MSSGGAVEFPCQAGEYVRCRAVDREPRREPVTAATQRSCHRADVEPADRPQRSAPPVRADLLEHQGDLGLAGAANDVDHTLDVLLTQARRVAGRDDGVHETQTACGRRIEFGAAEHGGQHAQPRERVAVEQRPRHRVRIHPGGEQSRGGLVGGGCGPPEGTGVGEQARVERAGGRFGERRAEFVDQTQHERRRRLGAVVDQTHRAEALVRHVVVDHENVAARGGHPVGEHAEAVEGAAVQHHQQFRRRGHLVGGHEQARVVQLAQ